MPDPPSVGFVTRYLFENPWPIGLGLVAVACLVAWNGMRRSQSSPFYVAVGVGAAGIVVFILEFIVITSGEEAVRVTKTLVQAVVDEDVGTAKASFAPSATLTAGSPRNPGFDIDVIQEHIFRLADRYDIESNQITKLQGYSDSAHSATVHLACRTTVAAYPYPNLSEWVLSIALQDDQTWRITQITCISINNRVPSSQELW